tara:strand:+ start:2400 stop:3449 length:1050 start_codon:yes stop_codon:yes gene_type:complete
MSVKTIDAGIQLMDNGKYRVNVMLKGKRMTKVMDTEDEARALRDEFKAGRKPEVPVSKTIGEIWDLFKAKRDRAKEAKGKVARPSDLQWVGHHIMHFCGCDTQANTITPALACGLFDHLTKTLSLKPSSVNEVGSCFYQMQEHAYKRGFMTTKPVRMDRLPESEGRYRYLSDEEEANCINWMKWNADPAEYTKFLFMLDTGCRDGEATALTWPDCDTNTGRITFWGDTTKTGRSRTVGMSERLKNRLKELHRSTNHPFVFSSVPTNKFYDTWQRMRKAFGLLNDPQFVIYALRHTCATRLMAAGVDVVTVQHWMGHKDISTTMRYSHFMPERLALATAAINNRTTHVSA